MDPITHTCSGILLGQGLRPLTAVRKATLLVGGLAAFAPDIDSVSYLWGSEVFYRVHHTYTHTVVGVIVVALVLAAIESRWLNVSIIEPLFLCSTEILQIVAPQRPWLNFARFSCLSA